VKTVRFVPIAEEYIADILAIEQEANAAPWSERSFRHELTNPHSVFRVVLVDGKVAGFGGVWLVIDEAHVTTVRIRQDYHRKGLGWRLMVNLLEAAQEAGMLCSTLEVRVSNAPAIALYRRLGFESTAIRKAYYPDNREDAMVMWLSGLDSWSAPPKGSKSEGGMAGSTSST
jgi:ribosomal-protein-alanine N-acetyltransferase